MYCSGAVANLATLARRIQAALAAIDDKMREAVFGAYVHRLQTCIDADSGHFEK